MVHAARTIHSLRGDHVGRHSLPVRMHARDGEKDSARDRTVFRR